MISEMARLASPQLGGDVRPSLRSQGHYSERCESMSSPEPAPAPLDRGEIEIRAYTIYYARGCVDGHDVIDWLEAERQLLLEAGINSTTAPATEPSERDPAAGVAPAPR